MALAVTTSTTTRPRGWVLYDGQCSFCARWLSLVRGTLEKHGFQADVLQAPWVAERLNLPVPELLRDIRLLTSDGHLITGADAYLHVLRRIWWTRPVGVLFSLPGFKSIFWFVYRQVAKRRYCIAGTCQLPAKAKPTTLFH